MNSSLVEVGWCRIATYLVSLPTPRIVTANMIVIIFNVFLAIFTVLINALFISTYLSNRILQNTSNMLLIVLAVSDILVGVLAQPIAITRATMEIYGAHNCFLFDTSRLIYIFCSGLSFLTNIVITHDRYIAIYYPLRYPIIFSKRNVKIVLIGCGIILIALLVCRAVLPLEIFFLIICSLTFYTTLSALVVYCRILLAARRQKLQIQIMVRSTRLYRPTISLHEIKTTQVMVYVLGAMILCYYPGTCFWIYSAYHGYTLESLYTIVPYLELSVFLNSAINPVTYLLRSRTIRGAFLRHINELWN
ncbi:adenosine receptor A2a-like [Dendronephthya gigantea]|uniref:adenosine receptor A2a-like n=1 Tax=Dendronephthya gigantea TaxID=151771 RepID=UPI00106C0D09|nr:adenosine receptor A2a-like [Dendronephthya gigantea]